MQFKASESGHGFHITLANGATVSVQHGPGMNCSNKWAQFHRVSPPVDGKYEDAEVAAWDEADAWIRAEGHNDDVLGWQSPAEVETFIKYIAGKELGKAHYMSSWGQLMNDAKKSLRYLQVEVAEFQKETDELAARSLSIGSLISNVGAGKEGALELLQDEISELKSIVEKESFESSSRNVAYCRENYDRACERAARNLAIAKKKI